MKYCTRCLYPANHPLHITFDAAGVCSGCRVHEEKDVLDWRERGEVLRRLLDGYRSTSGNIYDCIVPVSGARDSYFIVHTLKYVYGMNPLLVGYNRQYNTHRGIRNLSYLRTLMDCDFMAMVLSPELVKRVTRYTLRRLGSMYWHCLAGQTVFPVQIAARLKIPLIVWGVHQGCDQVGMFSHLNEVEMTRRYRKDHDLMGLEAEDIASDRASGLSESDLAPFCYPHDKEIEKVGVRGIYLSNYIRWDSKRQHEEMIARYSYETALQQRTFDTYNDVDCLHYSGLHDYVKFLKHGYGKVTDHACREIRLRRLTREDGIALVKRYRDRRPSDVSAFLRWIDMTEAELFDAIDAHRDPRVWRRVTTEWELLDCVTEHEADEGVADVRLGTSEGCAFDVTPSRAPHLDEEQYVLLAKGHVDEGPPEYARALAQEATHGAQGLRR